MSSSNVDYFSSHSFAEKNLIAPCHNNATEQKHTQLLKAVSNPLLSFFSAKTSCEVKDIQLSFRHTISD